MYVFVSIAAFSLLIAFFYILFFIVLSDPYFLCFYKMSARNVIVWIVGRAPNATELMARESAGRKEVFNGDKDGAKK